jgi:hypothetical protein
LALLLEKQTMKNYELDKGAAMDNGKDISDFLIDYLGLNFHSYPGYPLLIN